MQRNKFLSYRGQVRRVLALGVAAACSMVALGASTATASTDGDPTFFQTYHQMGFTVEHNVEMAMQAQG